MSTEAEQATMARMSGICRPHRTALLPEKCDCAVQSVSESAAPTMTFRYTTLLI